MEGNSAAMFISRILIIDSIMFKQGWILSIVYNLSPYVRYVDADLMCLDVFLSKKHLTCIIGRKFP